MAHSSIHVRGSNGFDSGNLKKMIPPLNVNSTPSISYGILMSWVNKALAGLSSSSFGLLIGLW